MIVYLYIKTHNITGLKYFGRTENKNPFKYKGSGIYWLKHLKKHGCNFTTEIYGTYTSLEECHKDALEFSIKNNIVDSKEWANLKEEDGYATYTKCHLDKTKLKISLASKTFWADPDNKLKMKNIHKTRFLINPDLKINYQTIAKLSVAKQIHNGTYEKATEARVNGRKKFLNSLTKEEYNDFYSWTKQKRSDTWKNKISNALLNSEKTEDHKKALAISKQKNKGIFKDHKNEHYEIHKDFCRKYSIDPTFYKDLNTLIKSKSVFEKLGLDYEENKHKTKKELGFMFISI